MGDEIRPRLCGVAKHEGADRPLSELTLGARLLWLRPDALADGVLER
jgi:hypothetical protein